MNKNWKIIGFSMCLFVAFNAKAQRTEQLLPNEELIPYFSKGKLGASDKQGKLIIPAKYSSIDRFFFGAAKVTKDEKVGVVDATGKEIVPVEYDGITNFVYTPGLGFSFGVTKGNKMGIITPTKTILPLTENIEQIIVIEDTLNDDIMFATLQKSGATYLISLIDKNGTKLMENIIADGVKPIKAKDLKNNSSRYDYDDYDYDEVVESVYEDYDEYDNYNRRDFNEENYYAVSGYENTFLLLKKKISLEKSIYALYNLQGKNVIDFGYQLTNIKNIGTDYLLLTSVNKDADCKNPTKYGIYQLSTNTYMVQPQYDFFKIVTETKKPKEYDDYEYSEESQYTELLKICETLNAMHIKTPEDLIANKTILSDLLDNNSIGDNKSYYVFGSEDAIKVLDDKLNIVMDVNSTDGKFRPEQAFVIKNESEISCAIEVFNNQYRGIGLVDLKTKNYVINPVYTEIRSESRYGNSEYLLLESENGNRVKYNLFSEHKPFNQDLIAKKGYYKQLNNGFALFKNEKDKIAIYSAALNKFISGYDYSYDEYSMYDDYDYEGDNGILKEVNGKTFFMLQNDSEESTVLNEKGEVIVPLTKNTLRFVDYYDNEVYYVVEYERNSKTNKNDMKFYGLDGTKFFK